MIAASGRLRNTVTTVLVSIAMISALTVLPRAQASPSAGATAPPTAAMTRCDLGTGPTTYCGSIKVPLDRTDSRSALITIGYTWIPARSKAVGTVLAQEGGPGYPSSGTAADFVMMYGSLLDSRNLLLVDARGTGRSTLINCSQLQNQTQPAARSAVLRAVAACGNQLNHTWKRTDGTWQHGSQMFTTAATVEDVAAVITQLKLGKVDLYGDSYGSYFSQAFMARHPQMLRSVVLDSTYETVGLDPFYATSVTVARRAFNLACTRSPSCRAQGGSSWARIATLAQKLRARPLRGTVPGLNGGRTSVTVDVRALVNMVNDAGYDSDVYRQLDPAVRAALAGDATPLLRLYAQNIAWDYSDYAGPAASYSDGLYFAVACTDYPQLFDMRATPAKRQSQYDEAVGKAKPSTFAPFTTAEWTGMLDYTETFAGCLTWPSPVGRVEPPVPTGGALNPGRVPVLILAGEFDSLTPDIGARHVARQIGSTATVLESANNPHLVALENPLTTCGEVAVQTFVRTLKAVSPKCLASVPPLVLRAAFPSKLAAANPGTVVRGHASAAQRRAASTAWGLFVDAADRAPRLDGSTEAGLRGGTISHSADGTKITFRNVRWVGDARVNGVVTLGKGGRLTVRSDAGQVWVVTVPGMTANGIGTVCVGTGLVRTAG